MRRAILSSQVVLGVAILGGLCPTLAVGANCPPKNLDQSSLLRGGLPVDREALSFSYRSKIYPFDVLSAFTRPASPDVTPNYCIRYEVLNKAQDAIEKFYWPLAGIQLDTLKAGERVSLAITKPPGRDPTIEESWIYAFLNVAVRTYAFQRRAEGNPPSLVRVAFGAPNNQKRPRAEAANRNMQFAALDGVEQRFELKEPIKFPEVSAAFSSEDALEISSTSEASWDGKSSRIGLSLGINSPKNSVLAPIAYALAKAGDAFDFLRLIREFSREQTPLPFDDDNKFNFARQISPEKFGGSTAMYVVEEPVYVVTSNGKKCFNSPIYSPIPIPTEFLECRLF